MPFGGLSSGEYDCYLRFARTEGIRNCRQADETRKAKLKGKSVRRHYGRTFDRLPLKTFTKELGPRRELMVSLSTVLEKALYWQQVGTSEYESALASLMS